MLLTIESTAIVHMEYRLHIGAQNLLFLQEDAHSSGTAGCGRQVRFFEKTPDAFPCVTPFFMIVMCSNSVVLCSPHRQRHASCLKGRVSPFPEENLVLHPENHGAVSSVSAMPSISFCGPQAHPQLAAGRKTGQIPADGPGISIAGFSIRFSSSPTAVSAMARTG